MEHTTNIAPYLDFAHHAPTTTEENVKYLCDEVLKNGFNAAFINPFYIEYAKNIMNHQGKVGSVVSFPLGQETSSIKIKSVETYFKLGANELDIALNIGCIKEKKWDDLLTTMKEIVYTGLSLNANNIIKFIPETGELTESEIKKIAELIAQSGAQFIKTCSGHGPRGATLEDVHTIRKVVGKRIQIKVAGGIKTYEQACLFIEAGADRIGTSRALDILKEQQKI